MTNMPRMSLSSDSGALAAGAHREGGELPRGRAELLSVGGAEAERMTFEPVCAGRALSRGQVARDGSRLVLGGAILVRMAQTDQTAPKHEAPATVSVTVISFEAVLARGVGTFAGAALPCG